MKKNLSVFTILVLLLSMISCGPKWTETESNGIKLVKNEGGKSLGYSTSSGIKLLTADRYAFKDLNKNGKLDKYEDWRLAG